jgi:hypothetical protein
LPLFLENQKKKKMSSTSTTSTSSTSSSAHHRGHGSSSSSPRRGGGGGGGGNNASNGFPHIQHSRPQRAQQPAAMTDQHVIMQNNHKMKAKEQVSPVPTAGLNGLLLENPVQGSTTRPSASASPLVSAGAGQNCIVCCEPVEYCSLGVCNHHEVCHVCSLRLRALYKSNSCSFCKVINPFSFTTLIIYNNI